MTESTAVTVRAQEPDLTTFEVIERVIANGDLSKMTAAERVAFYWRTCQSTGLNPLTRPFEFINLSGRLTMYAKRDATDQLRRIHRVSIDRIEQSLSEDGILTATAYGRTPDGRTDSDVGSVSVKGLSGDARANATKKAITQAKRRLTLSLVGLGFLDESELPEGAGIDVDPETGEILERTKPKSLIESVRAQQEAMAAETPAPTEEAEAAPDAEPVEEAAWQDVTDATSPLSLSAEDFTARRQESGIDAKVIVAKGKELFPDAKGLSDLDDAQRGALWAAVDPARQTDAT